MRVGRILLAAAIPFLSAACDTTSDLSDPLAPDTEAAGYLDSSGGGATVTDGDVVAAVDDGYDFIQIRPQFRFLTMDIEARAWAAGLDLANLTDYQVENLGDLLGYNSSEWDQILADLTNLMIDLETAVPELGTASYEEAAQAIVGRDSMIYQTDVFVPIDAVRPGHRWVRFDALGLGGAGCDASAQSVAFTSVAAQFPRGCLKASGIAVLSSFGALGTAYACYQTGGWACRWIGPAAVLAVAAIANAIEKCRAS